MHVLLRSTVTSYRLIGGYDGLVLQPLSKCKDAQYVQMPTVRHARMAAATLSICALRHRSQITIFKTILGQSVEGKARIHNILASWEHIFFYYKSCHIYKKRKKIAISFFVKLEHTGLNWIKMDLSQNKTFL